MALGASFYLLDTLEAPFYALETLQVCSKCVKKVKRSPKESQAQLCPPDGPSGKIDRTNEDHSRPGDNNVEDLSKHGKIATERGPLTWRRQRGRPSSPNCKR